MDTIKHAPAMAYVRRQAGAIRRFMPEVPSLPAVTPVAFPDISGLAPRAVWAWATVAVCAAIVPFLPGLTGARMFFVRDLTMFFWGRYLWLRQELLSGHFPLWDPYVGAGQSAVADAAHQLFLLPALAVRLIGSEVVGFNLWVASPFPLAALGSWLFFRRRFAPDASALGAIAFALSGPIVSTGNFPNLSWSSAAIPWMLWAVDRVVAAPTPRHLAELAVVTSLQAFAGEPVTLLATVVVSLSFAAFASVPAAASVRQRALLVTAVASALVLGLAVAAVELVPLGRATAGSERAAAISHSSWSLHPLALVEVISLHLFGDFFSSQSLAMVPWLPAMNGGREPLLFSIYLGVPLLSIAVFGLVANGLSRWTGFWTVAGAITLMGAFGDYTPAYPFVRDHLPFLPSLRSPAKYMVILSMVIAAGAATGWEAMNRSVRGPRCKNARLVASGFALALGALAWIFAGLCMYLPNAAARQFYDVAMSLHIANPVQAAAHMLRTMPHAASSVLLLSVGSAILMSAGTRPHQRAALARTGLLLLVVTDLIVHAWGINPTISRDYLAEPEWLALTRAQPDSRFYVGGKTDGTLDAADLDSSGAYLNPPGLSGSMSRAALSTQANFYPSGWRSREMLSYDLAVLWPRDFAAASQRFFRSGRFERDLFLDRTGVRYRVLPQREAGGRTPLLAMPYMLESFLFDYGDRVAPRVMVVSDTKVVGDLTQQIEQLFTAGWDIRSTAAIEREPAAAGVDRPPVPASAAITRDTANRVIVDAGVGQAGGYVVLHDSFSGDWRATADGQPADIVRANGLFRAVRLNPGPHIVEFVYRPRAFLLGSAASAAALTVVMGLGVWPRRRGEAAASADNKKTPHDG